MIIPATGQGKILLISDNSAVNKTIVDLLRPRDYELTVVSDVQSGINLLEDGFDVVLLKHGLVGCDTRATAREILLKDSLITMLVVAEDKEGVTLDEFRNCGVLDLVALPLHIETFLLLIKFAVKLHILTLENKKIFSALDEKNVSLQKQNILLARRIEESTKNLSQLYDNLRSTYMRTVKALAEAIDARDHYTHSHSQNVTRYANLIADELGLSLKEKEVIRQACELHDIGKIGIDDRILTKQSELTEDEWKIIRQHSIMGAQILEPLTFLEDVVVIVRQHHEHYDGSGYPDGLKGEQISQGARIIGLADAYDAMTSSRSYRQKGLSKEEAIEEIKRNSGTQFDPKIVEAFLKIIERI